MQAQHLMQLSSSCGRLLWFLTCAWMAMMSMMTQQIHLAQGQPAHLLVGKLAGSRV